MRSKYNSMASFRRLLSFRNSWSWSPGTKRVLSLNCRPSSGWYSQRACYSPEPGHNVQTGGIFCSSFNYAQYAVHVKRVACSTSSGYWRSFGSSVESTSGEEGDGQHNIDTPEFVKLVADHQKRLDMNLRLIDVREPEELVESGEIPGTINIPRE